MKWIKQVSIPLTVAIILGAAGLGTALFDRVSALEKDSGVQQVIMQRAVEDIKYIRFRIDKIYERVKK